MQRQISKYINIKLILSFLLGATSIYIVSAGTTIIDTNINNALQVIERIIIGSGGSSAEADRLVDLNTGGNVFIKNSLGIGKTLQGVKLAIKNNDDTTTEPLRIYNDNGNLTHSFEVDSYGNSYLKMYKNDGTATFDIGGNGYVGIGTTSPSAKLEVNGDFKVNGYRPITLSPNSPYGISIQGDAGGWAFGYKVLGYSGTDLGGFGFYGGGDLLNRYYIGKYNNEKISILESNGNVGIGVQNPGAKLHIQSSSTGQYHKTFAITNIHGDYRLFVEQSLEGDNQPYHLYMRNTGDQTTVRISPQGISYLNGGNVGIGTISPTYKLQVMGDIASNSTVLTSDKRYKKNISTLHNSLKNILKLRGVNFNRRQSEFPEKNFKDGTQIGVIAQEIEKVYPELVSTDSKGYKSVSYASFTPILIEAIKEQQKIINKQEYQIDFLSKQVQSQNKKIDALMNLVDNLYNISK